MRVPPRPVDRRRQGRTEGALPIQTCAAGSAGDDGARCPQRPGAPWTGAMAGTPGRPRPRAGGQFVRSLPTSQSIERPRHAHHDVLGASGSGHLGRSVRDMARKPRADQRQRPQGECRGFESRLPLHFLQLTIEPRLTEPGVASPRQPSGSLSRPVPLTDGRRASAGRRRLSRYPCRQPPRSGRAGGSPRRGPSRRRTG
jgi:hypothetical protein